MPSRLSNNSPCICKAIKRVADSAEDEEALCINSIRALGAAMPQAAKSGHPGAPMGCAPMAHALFGHIMHYTSKDHHWWNRDRFVLSNGHACALLYAMLHLTNQGLSIDDLKKFRQLNSPCPGHPENFITKGVEVTTGPLGQGISAAAGMAIAAQHLAAVYNKEDITLFDNYIYVICGDGCLQEGVSTEASSLAGHLQLGKLICLYDSNGITIDGATHLSFTEDVVRRYRSYGWHVDEVERGDTDLLGIVCAVEQAKLNPKPSMIVVKTTIGYGSVKQGSHSTHGAPIGDDDIRQCRQKWGLDPSDFFAVPEAVRAFYRTRETELGIVHDLWQANWTTYQQKYPKEAQELMRRFRGETPPAALSALPTFSPADKPEATRSLSNKMLNTLAHHIPEIMGGSADLTDSNKTGLKGIAEFDRSNYAGRYIRFGVREHGMTAIANGLCCYGGFRPFAATFLNFVTYAWGALRLAALSHHGMLFVATHDSIELGEDGPTHQPVEVLPLLRATPNLLAIRPADGNETAGAYAIWCHNTTRPTVVCLSRGNVPHLDGTSVENTWKGAYVLQDWEVESQDTNRIILAASGSELQLAFPAAKIIESKGFSVRIVSMPCWELFCEQSQEYQKQTLPDNIRCCAYVEASSAMGLERWFDRDASTYMETFGASAPQKDLWRHFGFTAEAIAEKILRKVQ